MAHGGHGYEAIPGSEPKMITQNSGTKLSDKRDIEEQREFSSEPNHSLRLWCCRWDLTDKKQCYQLCIYLWGLTYLILLTFVLTEFYFNMHHTGRRGERNEAPI